MKKILLIAILGLSTSVFAEKVEVAIEPPPPPSIKENIPFETDNRRINTDDDTLWVRNIFDKEKRMEDAPAKEQ